MPRTKGALNKKVGKAPEQLDADVVAWAKAEVIRLFDAGEIEDLSSASEKVGVSKLKLYSWRKADKAWRLLLDQAREPTADRLLKEIMVDTMPNGKPVSMPYITARLFVIKQIRPSYREAWKFVVEDSSVMQHLAELKRLATKEKPTEEKKTE